MDIDKELEGLELEEDLDNDEDQEDSEKDEDIIQRAKDNFDKIYAKLESTITIGKEVRDFVNTDDQWTEEEKRKRKGKPCKTINKMPQFVNSVVNKLAINKPRIKVRPFEDSDQDKAKVINGLLMSIQYGTKSDAGNAYDNAYKGEIEGGIGAWRIDTVFCNDKSFDKDIVINKIEDSLTVFLDEEDDDYCLIFHTVDKNEYGKDVKGWEDSKGVITVDKNEICVCEYWEKKKTETTLYQIQLPEVLEIEQETIYCRCIKGR